MRRSYLIIGVILLIASIANDWVTQRLPTTISTQVTHVNYTSSGNFD
jgi:hypothetical protein